MNADSVYINFNDDFDAVERSLNAARKEFLNASKSYDLDGERFKDITITQLKLLGEAHSAIQIQEGVITAIASIRRFNATHAFLTSQVTLLLLALNQNILSTAIKMIPTGVFEKPADSTLSIQDTVSNYIKNLDAKQRENVALAAAAILLGHQVADVVRAAAQPIAMRQGTLEQTARGLAPELPGAPGAIGNVIGVGGEAVAGEFKMTVLEEVLKQAAFELGTHIPIAGIVVSIARVANDIRARQAALKERYELQLRIRGAHYHWGPIDVMFGLPAQLEDEDQITAGVQALIQQILDALSPGDA